MKKILSKRQLLVALLSIVLFVTSMGLILGIKANKVSAVENTSVTTGVKFTYNTAVTGNQVPAFNFKLSSPVSIKGASEIAFHIDLGSEAQKDQLYFGLVDEKGNYYEFAGSGSVQTHQYRVSNSLMGLVSASKLECGSWTATSYLANGTYFSFDLDNIFWRGSLNNYPVNNNDVNNIVGGGTLSDETKIAAISIRVSDGGAKYVSFTISEMFARYDGGYKKLVDFSTFKPINKTNTAGTNTNGWSKDAGYYCQTTQALGSATTYGWLSELTELYANHEVIKAESANVVSKDGLALKANGVTTNVETNGSLIVNLPENVSMADVKNIWLTLDVGATYTQGLVPFVIDTNGNYYELMGKDGLPSTTIKAGKTYNSFEQFTMWSWGDIVRPTPNDKRGDYGKTIYSIQIKDFYWRVRFDNYGGDKTDSSLTTSGSLTNDVTIHSIGVRVNGTSYQTVDVIFGDAYFEKNDGSIVRILDASAVEVNAENNFIYTYLANTAWLGYIAGWGGTNSLGWLTACYHVGGETQYVNGMDLSVVAGEKATGEFDGVNYKMTVDSTNKYQRIIAKGNGEDIKNKTLIVRYKDNSGLGHHYELRVRSNGVFAGVNGSKQYFVDKNFNLVSSATDGWATYPPKGFDGYVVVDLSTVTNTTYLAFTDFANVDLGFGFHQDWINNGLVDVTFGDILISETKPTTNSDFEALINDSELYCSFTNDNAIDGINDTLVTESGLCYGTTLTRIYSDADEIDAVIDMIESATLNDLTALSEIENAYNALSDNVKAQIVNAGVLNRKLEIKDELEAFANSFDMVDGAAVRLVAGSNGMKFAATMDKDAYTALETLLTDKGITFKMGTLIAPTDYGTLTVDSAKKLDIERTLWGEEVDGKLMMNAAITNILEDNYARDFSAIAYLSFEYEGETVVIYAGEVVSRSAKTVALEALADQTKTWTQAQLDVLNAYAGI